MGIYPESKFIPVSTGYLEEVRTPGLTRRRELAGGPWTEERTNCFCCSCDDDWPPAGDPNCRNHGWWGSRPCETHGMAGQVEPESGEMPASVEEVRSARTART